MIPLYHKNPYNTMIFLHIIIYILLYYILLYIYYYIYYYISRTNRSPTHFANRRAISIEFLQPNLPLFQATILAATQLLSQPAI